MGTREGEILQEHKINELTINVGFKMNTTIGGAPALTIRPTAGEFVIFSSG